MLLASANKKKILEIAPFLPGHGIQVPGEAGISWQSPEENGQTFLDNAIIKAESLFAISGGIPVLADDSGLCIDALDGRPGIHSARYGSVPDSPPLSDHDRNLVILDEMRGKQDRSCRFVCALVLIVSKYRRYCVQETCEGQLLEALRGTGGFGYDPLFYIPELSKTMAELSAEEKNKVSHRGRALRKLRALLE